MFSLQPDYNPDLLPWPAKFCMVPASGLSVHLLFLHSPPHSQCFQCSLVLVSSLLHWYSLCLKCSLRSSTIVSSLSFSSNVNVTFSRGRNNAFQDNLHTHGSPPPVPQLLTLWGQGRCQGCSWLHLCCRAPCLTHGRRWVNKWMHSCFPAGLHIDCWWRCSACYAMSTFILSCTTATWW